MIVRGRGIIGKPRRVRGLVRMCWYCGSHTGEIPQQPDGTHLHDVCEGPAARDYPNRPACDGERVDDKVARQDVRGDEEDAGAFWA